MDWVFPGRSSHSLFAAWATPIVAIDMEPLEATVERSTLYFKIDGPSLLA